MHTRAEDKTSNYSWGGSVDSSAPLFSAYTNIQHWTEQVSWNYARINEWQLTQRIAAPGVLVLIFVL